jgi:hypothetical protein
VLIVRQTDGGWHADCEGSTAEAAALADALRGAIVLGAGVIPIRRDGDADLQRWIETTAGHIVGDITR